MSFVEESEAQEGWEDRASGQGVLACGGRCHWEGPRNPRVPGVAQQASVWIPWTDGWGGMGSDG